MFHFFETPCKSLSKFDIFTTDFRIILSIFVATDVYALLLKSYPEDFRPILSWVSSNPILGRNLSNTPGFISHFIILFSDWVEAAIVYSESVKGRLVPQRLLFSKEPGLLSGKPK